MQVSVTDEHALTGARRLARLAESVLDEDAPGWGPIVEPLIPARLALELSQLALETLERRGLDCLELD